MPLTNDHQLFARDLKHLVDPRYSVAPGKRRRKRPHHLLLGAGVLAFGVWLASGTIASIGDGDNAPVQVKQVTEQPVDDSVPLSAMRAVPASVAPETIQPPTIVQPAAAIEPPARELAWTSYKIRKGDTLGRIFKRQNLNRVDAVRVANHPEARILKKLMPGRKLEFGYDDGEFAALKYPLGTLESLVVDIGSDQTFAVEVIKAKPEKRVSIIAGTINSSLFRDGGRAGLSDKVLTQLVGIFGWDIDFALDLRKGDHFIVAYEELYIKGKRLGSGDILAATFVNQDRSLHAVRYQDGDGNAQYYDDQGDNLRGTFLRTPMQVSRVTSGFAKRRFHPILKKWRAHKGVDYGAPRGTKILSTADGRVSYIGRKKGYGKVIILRHGGNFSTLYAHLSSFKSGMRPGVNVKQGQVIGFVGRTGMATASHLHYEFRVRGAHRNPLTYKTPKADSISNEHHTQFLAYAETWMDRLAQHGQTTLALNETTTDDGPRPRD